MEATIRTLAEKARAALQDSHFGDCHQGHRPKRLAELLSERKDKILEANAKDLSEGEANGLSCPD